MKLAILAGYFGCALAVNQGYGSAPQEPAARQEQAVHSQQQAYGGAQQAGQQAYGQQAYGEPEPDEPVCLTLCPLDFPMLNPHTGQCSEIPPEPEEPAPQSYHGGSQYYGAQQRKLNAYGQQAAPAQASGQEYGGARQAQAQASGQEYGGARQAQAQASGHEYGSQEYGEEPYDLIDTSCGHVWGSGEGFLWAGFVIFFLTAWALLWRAQKRRCCADECCECDDGHYTSINYFLSPACQVSGLVCLIASLSYLIMATGNGYYVQCNARMFFYVRYIDWVITTPLLLWEIAHFANASDDWWIFIVFNNLIMIVAGFIGATIEYDRVKWGFFALAFLAFIPILYYLCKLSSQVCDNREYWCKTGLLVHEKDYGKDGTCYLPYIWFFDTLKRLVGLVALAWFIYPIIWIAAEGTGRLCVNGEVIAYTVLDIFTKAVFAWIICFACPMSKDKCKDKCKSGGCRLLMDFYD